MVTVPKTRAKIARAMQKKVTIFVLLAVVALAAIVIVQSKRAASAKAELAAAQEKSEAVANAAEAQKETIDQLEQQKKLMAQQLHEATAQQQAQKTLLAKQTKEQTRAALSESANAAGQQEEPKGGFLAKMMQDPAMKKMIAEQQKAMVGMMYGPLLKDLNLTPEETEKFNALLFDNQMNAATKGISVLQEGADKTAIGQELTEDKKQFDAKMKEFLGDDRYAQYEDYTKSLPDRMALTQVKSQFGDNPLNEQQSSQLLTLMKEERQRANPTPNENPSGSADFNTALSEDAMNKYFSQQKQANQRVVERAAGVLTPEQIEVLSRSLASNLSMQEAGMKMAQAMMGKGTPATAPK